MNVSFTTVSLSSFHMWLDNYLLQKGQAYLTTTSRLYYQPDPTLPPGYVAYASPFRSWVWDSGVSGATVLSNISGSTGPISRGQSGMLVDFVNGRVLLTGVGTKAVLSGTYSFKELNTYKSNDTQERMVFTDKYYLNSRFGNPATGVPAPNAMVTPAVFVTNSSSENENWAFGGLYNTKQTMSLVVMAENPLQLEGTLSLIRDAKDSCFPLLDTSLWPLNQFGDYKSGYNYQGYLSSAAANNLCFITEVRSAKVGDYTKIDEAIYLGIVDVTVEKARTIR